MQAIILAAGFGTRLRAFGNSKPLTRVAGRPLIFHVLDRLGQAGIEEALIVTGHEAGAVEAAVGELRSGIRCRFLRTPDPAQPNGVSALAAAPFVMGRALLCMSDHLVDPALYHRVARTEAEAGELLLGVDRRLAHPWVDADDVTCVRTDGARIESIGKGIAGYNGYDTGVFSVDHGLFAALTALEEPSLTGGVALMAGEGRARAVETGDDAWLDVDDPRALEIAECWLQDGAGRGNDDDPISEAMAAGGGARRPAGYRAGGAVAGNR